jgi:hypothetical protein
MGEILGIGLTHYPGLLRTDADMSIFLRRTLTSARVPAALKDPARWPAAMREEWADDQGAAAAAGHRKRLVDGFRRVRRALDAFRPDFLVIWGDDQYECFTEDCVPPFCVFVVDEVLCAPFASVPDNVWGEPADKAFAVRGHLEGGKYLARRLIEEDCDVSYAYRVRHPHGLAHAFVNTLLYLDHDRTGFPHPVVPFHVNCYGSSVVRSRGGMVVPGHESAEPDPPAPTPRRCFDVGRATARVLAASPWRVALVASSSWSHAFLTEKNAWIYPDVDSDRARFEELATGRYDAWRRLTTAQVEAAGQHEFLNWVCLAGAMSELSRAPEIVDYIETHVFNSDKCFALFPPDAG